MVFPATQDSSFSMSSDW